MIRLYKRALELCKSDKNMYRRKVIESYNHKYEFFTYNLPSYKKFKEDNSFFMRGFCVIDESIISPSIHKFFNFKENEDWSDLNLNDNNLIISEKYDGSLLIPYIVDNEVHFRTKMNVYSEYTDLAKYIMTKDQEKEIRRKINNKIFPMFELTSLNFRIVVEYDKPELRYLGSYYFHKNVDVFESIHNFDLNGTLLKYFPIKNINEYLESVKNFEGFVIKNEINNKIYKLKSSEYVLLHSFSTTDDNNYHLKIESIINETIDDLIFKLPEKVKDEIIYIKELITQHFNNSFNECEEILDKDKDLSRKDFAIKYKDFEFFNYIINVYANRNASSIDRFKEFYLNKYCRKSLYSFQLLNSLDSKYFNSIKVDS